MTGGETKGKIWLVMSVDWPLFPPPDAWYWLLCVEIIWICQSPTQTIMLQENKNYYRRAFNSQHKKSRILTAVVQHSILNLSYPCFKFQVSLIDLSQSNIWRLYGLQIDNDIRPELEFSGTSLWFMVSILDLLYHFLFQFIKMVALFCK